MHPVKAPNQNEYDEVKQLDGLSSSAIKKVPTFVQQTLGMWKLNKPEFQKAFRSGKRATIKPSDHSKIGNLTTVDEYKSNPKAIDSTKRERVNKLILDKKPIEMPIVLKDGKTGEMWLFAGNVRFGALSGANTGDSTRLGPITVHLITV